MKAKVNIIGSGFSSLSAASCLAKQGYEVHVFEKNSTLGGRARQMEMAGCKFDMGPTWYWMPDVFEHFFALFDKKPEDYYALDRLDPAYNVFYEDEAIKIPGNLEEIYALFDSMETGGAGKLKGFLDKAQDNYDIAIKDLVYLPGDSPMELINWKTLSRMNRFFTNIRKDVKKIFKNVKLQQILEFPVLFLGAKPEDTPGFYSFMNYADLVLGTWYPQGGMYSVVKGMESLALELGVNFHFNANVERVLVENGIAKGVFVNGKDNMSDIVLSSADYHHSETLLPAQYRQYSEKYWESKTFAPSALLFYVVFDKKLQNINHHCLFFDKSFDTHAQEIYDAPQWPSEPLFYGSFPSISDDTIGREGVEMATFLVPLAPGIIDGDNQRDKVFNNIINRFEILTNQKVRNNVLEKRSYCVNDFVEDYNSFKGNAYGLANNLMQTAFLRPKLKSKKVKGLYFTGQLTVPGPGVPPALISGEIVSNLIKKEIHEKNF